MFFLQSLAGTKKCIFANSNTAGLSNVEGLLVDDGKILKTNWKVGMKVSKIDFCIAKTGVLNGFWLTISDYAAAPKEVKLNLFGTATDACSSVGLAKDEWITSIGTQFNQFYG